MSKVLKQIQENMSKEKNNDDDGGCKGGWEEIEQFF
jgi:hypothetical protein